MRAIEATLAAVILLAFTALMGLVGWIENLGM
jgi:hypothetical protein